MSKEIYEDVAENLLKVIPVGWDKICLYAQLTKSSYEFFFYVKIKDSYIQCFELEKQYGIDRKKIREVFKVLNNIIRPDFQEKNYFVMTYILTNKGKFNVDYEYTDYSENTLEYKEQWIKKYIK